MAPIINPWWFYAIETLNGLRDIFQIAGAVAIFVAGAYLLNSVFENEKVLIKKGWLTLGVICVLLGNLTPKQETCYKMLAASLMTPSNIEYVGETATDMIDYLVDSIDTLLEEEEK